VVKKLTTQEGGSKARATMEERRKKGGVKVTVKMKGVGYRLMEVVVSNSVARRRVWCWGKGGGGYGADCGSIETSGERMSLFLESMLSVCER